MPRRREEPAVAPARSAAADVALEEGDADPRRALGQLVGGPHPREPPADHADVGADASPQRGARGAGIFGERLLEPEAPPVAGRGDLDPRGRHPAQAPTGARDVAGRSILVMPAMFPQAGWGGRVEAGGGSPLGTSPPRCASRARWSPTTPTPRWPHPDPSAASCSSSRRCSCSAPAPSRSSCCSPARRRSRSGSTAGACSSTRGPRSGSSWSRRTSTPRTVGSSTSRVACSSAVTTRGGSC